MSGGWGGIYTEHKTKSQSNSILTETTSMSGGEGIKELQNRDLTAMSTPPPREDLSLRYNIKSVGKISES